MFHLKTYWMLLLALALGVCAVAKAQHGVTPWQPNCTLATITGYYGYWTEGTLFMQQPGQATPVAVPATQVGMIAIDRLGKVSMPFITASLGGQTMEGGELVDASVEVNPDCTATFKFHLKPKGMPVLPVEGVAKWIILDNGDMIKELVVKGAMGQPVSLGTYRRISILPPK